MDTVEIWGPVANSIEKKAEAQDQQKTFLDHLTHMAIHGTLHLLGYDHIEDDQAKIMESLEVKILDRLQIKNPYL